MIDDINTKRTELANQMAAAGAAALDFNATAAVLAAIPDTEPQQYVAAGTPENIAAILPATISPARRMRHGDRPTEALVFDEPAATSGDAPADGWPSEIYLNAGDDPLGHFDEYADVSWCDHPQGENDVRYVRAELARIERTTAHVQPVNTSSERVENAAGNEQVERAAAPATASGDELPSIETDEFNMLLRAHRIAYQTAVDGFDPSDVKEVDENLNAAWKALIAHIDTHTRAAVSAATKPTADSDMLLRDMLAIQEACNLHTDEYAPGSVIEYIKELETDAVTKQTADLSKLPRFGTGLKYVKLADVQSLLATKPAGAPAKPIGTVIDHDCYAGESTIDVYLDLGDDVYAAPTAAPADHADKRAEILIEVEEAIDVVIRDLEFDVAERSGAISCRTAIRALKSAAPEGAEGAAS